MYALYVFDLDGTLVDSRRDIAESANQVLVDCGARPLPEQTIARMVGNGAPTLVAKAFAAAGIDRPADALERFLDVYDSRLLRHTRLYPRMDEVLETLHARAPLAVLTNKPEAATRAILAGLGVDRFFAREAVIGGDGRFARKPDPAGLRHLAARAGVRVEDALLVGDSVVDWRTAHDAPSALCLARYGFGFEDFPLESLTPADRRIDEPFELLSL